MTQERQAVLSEREAIVAWLRRIRSIKSCIALADAIERGYHLPATLRARESQP